MQCSSKTCVQSHCLLGSTENIWYWSSFPGPKETSHLLLGTEKQTICEKQMLKMFVEREPRIMFVTTTQSDKPFTDRVRWKWQCTPQQSCAPLHLQECQIRTTIYLNRKNLFQKTSFFLSGFQCNCSPRSSSLIFDPNYVTLMKPQYNHLSHSTARENQLEKPMLCRFPDLKN